MVSKKKFVSVCLASEQKELVSQAARKKGVSQSEFIRRVILSAAEDALGGGDDYGHNSPAGGAELVITEQGQSQLIRDTRAVMVMVSRLYGEMAAAKLGGPEAARNDVAKLHREVEEMITEHGLVFE